LKKRGGTTKGLYQQSQGAEQSNLRDKRILRETAKETNIYLLGKAEKDNCYFGGEVSEGGGRVSGLSSDDGKYTRPINTKREEKVKLLTIRLLKKRGFNQGDPFFWEGFRMQHTKKDFLKSARMENYPPKRRGKAGLRGFHNFKKERVGGSRGIYFGEGGKVKIQGKQPRKRDVRLGVSIWECKGDVFVGSRGTPRGEAKAKESKKKQGGSGEGKIRSPRAKLPK